MDVVVGEKVHIDPATGATFTYLECMHWETREVWENQLYVTSLFVLTFVLPMAFLTVSYGAIGRRLLTAQRHWCRFKHTGGGGGGGGGGNKTGSAGGNGGASGVPPYSVANSAVGAGASRTASNSGGGGGGKVAAAAESDNGDKGESKKTAAAAKQAIKQNGFIRSKPSRQSIKPSSKRGGGHFLGCARNAVASCSSSQGNSNSNSTLEAVAGTLALAGATASSTNKNPSNGGGKQATQQQPNNNNAATSNNRNKSAGGLVRLYAGQDASNHAVAAAPPCTNTNVEDNNGSNTGNNGNGNGNNGKVLICFDRRNTEFLNKMRVRGEGRGWRMLRNFTTKENERTEYYDPY